MLKYSPEITLYAGYVCNHCGEEKNVYPPTEKPTCEECNQDSFTFNGLFFWETFKFEKDGREPYWTGEAWMESTGIPICHFCQNRDYEADYDVLEEWLVYVSNSEEFKFYSACEFCQEKHGFQKIGNRTALDEKLNGLLSKTEALAEEKRVMLEAQIESDRLNYGEDYVLETYYSSTDEELEQQK